MVNYELILKDAITYLKITNNQNFKERLYEAYFILKENNIKSLKEFENSNLGIGAFTFQELTIFDRLKNEDYRRCLTELDFEVRALKNIPDDLGDILASYGEVGKTPYRDEMIKKGYMTSGLTEKEKIKYYK